MTTAAPLEGICLAALRWLHRRRDDFRLPDDPTAPGHDRNATLKPLGELAQLSRTIADVAGAGAAGRPARALFDFAWQESGRGEVFAALARREPHATYPLEMYAAFAQAGLVHQGFEAQVREVAATRSWRLAERNATRTLAVLHAERRLGLPPHCDPREARARTWLGGLAEPWSFTTHAGYAATHTVFHLTDWCTRPDLLSPAIADHLRLWLPAWLDCTVEAADWDLTGELLAVAALLPQLPGAAEAWTALGRAQRPDGSVPEHGAPTGPVAFHAYYHSTLVAAFAAAVTMAAAPTAVPPTALREDAR
ncbi:DUF6895 family protein [Streptomyces sp. NPDC088746]|uniref:DUF6895 family protein n=1 Tax=Streptomyces sp. NPDC088746 TaxID=3365885 RepID=UPI00381AC42D